MSATKLLNINISMHVLGSDHDESHLDSINHICAAFMHVTYWTLQGSKSGQDSAQQNEGRSSRTKKLPLCVTCFVIRG